jgi:hypothetical protein
MKNRRLYDANNLTEVWPRTKPLPTQWGLVAEAEARDEGAATRLGVRAEHGGRRATARCHLRRGKNGNGARNTGRSRQGAPSRITIVTRSEIINSGEGFAVDQDQVRAFADGNRRGDMEWRCD